MAATRLRLSPEHRNGNGNYLRVKHHGEWVGCKGEKDIGAFHAAFELLLEEEFGREAINAFRSKHKPASHD